MRVVVGRGRHELHIPGNVYVAAVEVGGVDIKIGRAADGAREIGQDRSRCVAARKCAGKTGQAAKIRKRVL